MTKVISRRAICLSTAVLTLAAAIPNFAGTAYAAGETIKLGLVAPMSGPNARYGSFSMRGAQLAVKEINDAGGVDGRKIELVSGDSQGTPVEGVSATRRLIDSDKVDFIIGDVSSSVTLAMQPVAEDARILLLNAASSNPKITYGAGVGGYQVDLPQLPDRREPRPDRRKVRRRAARASRSSPFFRSIATMAAPPSSSRRSICPNSRAKILTEDYYKEGEVDFRSVLAKIRDSGAQAIIMYGLADTTPIIARQMTEIGLAGKVPLIGNGEFNTAIDHQSRADVPWKAQSKPLPGCPLGTRPRARLSSTSSRQPTSEGAQQPRLCALGNSASPGAGHQGSRKPGPREGS